MARILYLSYTGMTESLGKSQVLSYIKETSKSNQMYLISVEREQVDEALKNEIFSSGFQWVYFYAKKNKILNFALIIYIYIYSLFLCKKHKVEIVHARSYLMGIVGMLLKKTAKIKYLFDARGFWFDELYENGRVKSSRLYGWLKGIESSLYRNADHVITLTHSSLPVISNMVGSTDNVTVIPTCVDLDHFDYRKYTSKDRHRTIKLAYVGSVAQRYLFDDVARLVKKLSDNINNLEFHIFTKDCELAQEICSKYHLEPIIKTVGFNDMPEELATIDCSIFFMKRTPGTLAMAPTKFAEFLAMGIPSIVNDKGSDVVNVVEKKSAGVVIRDFSNATPVVSFLQNSVDKESLRTLASDIYSLSDAVKKTNVIYQELNLKTRSL